MARHPAALLILLLGLIATACASTTDPAATGGTSPEPPVATAPPVTVAAPPTSEPQATATPTSQPTPQAASITQPAEAPSRTASAEPDAADDAVTMLPPGHHQCTLVEGSPAAPPGATELNVEVIVDGLEVPWSVAFLPDGDVLATERPGRLRLIRNGELVDEPVLTIDVSIPPPLFGVDALGSEGGLLGVLLHPDFESNRLFYLFHNAQKNGAEISRIDRFKLADDHRSATFERNILDDIPAGLHHQGGRMHIGPDDMLYVGVGAWEPELAQDLDNLSGKILRMDLDGGIPADNPDPTSRVFISGVRNSQGFDWLDDDHLALIEHGPSGFELDMPDLRGFDEINVVRAGENLGWPRVWGCENEPGLTHPVVSFESSVPPTGATVYRGEMFQRWQGSLLVTAVGGAPPRSNGRHLHRIRFSDDDPYVVVEREIYLADTHGRLRTPVEAPDGSIWLMTSNCDDRGVCPPERDRILRLTPG